MKARQAKKIAHTPVNKLSPKWWNAFMGGCKDTRIEQAIRKWRRNESKDNSAK